MVGEALAEFEVIDELDGGETSCFFAMAWIKWSGVDVAGVVVRSVRGLIGMGPLVDKCAANIPGVTFGAVGGVPGRKVKVLIMACACCLRIRELSSDPGLP